MVALLLLVCLLAGGAGYVYQQRQQGGGGGQLVRWSSAPKRDVVWTVTSRPGELPWNNVIYLMVTRHGVEAEYHARNLGDDQTVQVRGAREGERWHARSEQDPSAAEQRMLWMIEDKGEIGPEATAITIEAPARSRIELTSAASTQGIGQLMLYHEATDTVACGIRDPHAGLLFRIWDKQTSHYYHPRQTPTRPWTCDEFAAGEFVIAARIEGRQWVAQRERMEPGARLVVPTKDAPEGGGVVACDDPGAVLLLRGDLPIAAPRRADRDGLRFEARWEGVPPGKHALVHADGRRVEVTVTDGETTQLPK